MKTLNNKASRTKKATVSKKQLSPAKRRRFKPVLLIVLIFAFILPTLVFMAVHYLSDPTNDNHSFQASVLGETIEAHPSVPSHETSDSTEVLSHSESPDQQLTLSLPERYPEVFPELFPDLYPEYVDSEKPDRLRLEDIDTEVKVAYLTFDDGPSSEITPGILDILEEEAIKATFFVLPRNGLDDIYRRIINEGHELGNHSYSHNYTTLYKHGIEAFKEDITNASEFILSNFDYTMKNFRFPGGSMSWNSDEIEARIDVIEKLGYKHFDWHIDSGDAHPRQTDKSAQTLVSNVLENTNDIEHVIILMHDSGNKNTSLEALPAIIKGLREQGYIFGLLKNYPEG